MHQLDIVCISSSSFTCLSKIYIYLPIKLSLFSLIMYFYSMKKVNLHQPYQIVYLDTDSCPLGKHGHSFFELLYILSGTGTQNVNDNVFRYRKGDFFLITPNDH